MTLFCDMDGVLADFDAGYRNAFDIQTSKKLDNVNWHQVQAHGSFYNTLPEMPDMRVLWNYIKGYKPVLLSGCPTIGYDLVQDQKRQWIDEHLGYNVPAIFCKSREKVVHSIPGDILIDDWDKHQAVWIANGGIWILHTSAADTILQLREHAFYGIL